ncbi:hypothetical protein [uncultured Ruminococcus sp.]|uniref:hypothetical protein n=1 Tax=uncultured Ruminococcus sp. TaxID=165186 RepID=UPI00349FF826
MNVRKLSDFLPVSERLILPRLIFAVKIVVKSLSADFRCLTIKAYFTGDSAVIGLLGYEHQSFCFPDL